MNSVEFGTLFQFIRNGMNVKQDKSGDGLPITRIETISEATVDATRVGYADLRESDCHDWLMKEGDILFSHINSVEHIGKCAVYRGAPEKLVHGMNLLCLRCDSSKLLPEFAKYLIRGSEFRTRLSNFINKAVNQASVSIGNLKTIPVRVPRLAEQRRIAEVLDRVEALRSKRRAVLATLDTLIESAYFDLFGDFRNCKKVPLESLADQNRHALSSGPFGSSLTSKHYVEDGVLVLRGLNVTGGTINLQDRKFVSERKAHELSRSIVTPGDIVVVAVGSSGLACLIPEGFPRAVMSQNFNKISPNTNIVDPTYLRFTLNARFVQRQFVQNITDTVRTFLSLTKLRGVTIPLPDLYLQREFARRIALIDKLKQIHLASLSEMNALFAALQYRGFRGEL